MEVSPPETHQDLVQASGSCISKATESSFRARKVRHMDGPGPSNLFAAIPAIPVHQHCMHVICTGFFVQSNY